MLEKEEEILLPSTNNTSLIKILTTVLAKEVQELTQMVNYIPDQKKEVRY